MEMEFKDNQRKRRLAMLLGLVLAIAAGGAAFMMGSQAVDERRAPAHP